MFGNLASADVTSKQEKQDDDDNNESTEQDPEQYEAHSDYKPLVPLPNLIEVKTGEEDENVLFSERAKLFRYVGNEFKERGLGDLKILQHKQTGKLRVVMRRDVVHKLCANFALQPGMQLKPMQMNDKAWTWKCMDYSEGELTSETLAARFKTAEVANKFKEIFDQAVAGKIAFTPSPLQQQQHIATTTTGTTPTRTATTNLQRPLPTGTATTTAATVSPANFSFKLPSATGSVTPTTTVNHDTKTCIGCVDNDERVEKALRAFDKQLLNTHNTISYKFQMQQSFD